MVRSGIATPKFVLNSVTPIYSRDREFEQRLFDTFLNILSTANGQKEIRSLALPLLATGNYGAPKELCARVLIDSMQTFRFSLNEDQLNLKEIHMINIDKDTTKVLVKEIRRSFPQGNSLHSFFFVIF